MINSRLGHFTAASFEAPLIPKLRGQLAEFLDNPSPDGLRILSSSTCVGLRYGRLSIPQSFSRLSASHASLLEFRSLSPGATNARVMLSESVPLIKVRRLRNFNRMCIGYAFRPRLSSRLTLGGRTFPRKPETFGHYDSHIILATHSGILTCVSSSCAFAQPSPYCTTLPYPSLRMPKLRLYA